MINMLDAVYQNKTPETNSGLSNTAKLSQVSFSQALQQQMGDEIQTPTEPEGDLEGEAGTQPELLPSTNTGITTTESAADTLDTGSMMNTMMKLMQASMSMNTMSMMNGGSGGSDGMSSMMSMMMMMLLFQTLGKSQETAEVADNASTMANVQASDAYNAAQAAGTMEERAAYYESHISAASEKYNIASSLIKGIIQAESSFNPNTVSYAGAQGLMQLMPGTASGLGVTDAFDPQQNIDGGTNYISKMIERYNGDVKLALVAYNCGPGRVAQSGVSSSADAAYAELPKAARDYADKVMAYADNYAKAETAQTAIA